MDALIIVGAGGLGRETAALVEDINAETPRFDLLGFVDDDARLHHTLVQDAPVLGGMDWLLGQRNVSYVLAIGDPRTRQRLHQRLTPTGLTAATLRHPSVAVHRTTEIGPGVILCRGTTLTVSVRIGCCVVIDLHCTISHDVAVGDYTTVHPGVHLTGCVRTGVAAELGAGCTVLPGVEIGAGTTVGAGAVVTRTLPAGCTAVGVPARPVSP